MERTKTKRATIVITEGRYRHVLIEQSCYDRRTESQRGAYKGMTGYVLHRIEKL